MSGTTNDPNETTPLQHQPSPPPPAQDVTILEDYDTSATTSTINTSTQEPSCVRVLREFGLVDFLQTNSFVIKAAVAIGLAKLYPPLGAHWVYPQITATWLAVIFIFFMAGLSLQSNEFTKALGRFWFNLFVLTFNFGIVSLVVFGFTAVIGYFHLLPKGLLDGMMVCACMPITVTMVIVLTKSGGGDEAAAVLLAAVGSLLGVIVTPALLLAYIGVQSDVSFLQVFLKLVLRVVAPLLVGQVLQKCSTRIMAFVAQHKTKFKGLQEWALIFIVYTVFCKTFSKPIDANLLDILYMALFQGIALLTNMILAWFTLKCLFRNQPKLRVMGFYGCTQKSVAVGIPMIGALYEHDVHAGLYTLPLLIWHPLQLLIGSALAPHFAVGVSRLEAYLGEDGDSSTRTRQSFFVPSRTSFKDSIRRGSSVAFTTPSQMSWPMTGATAGAGGGGAGGDAHAVSASTIPILEEQN